MSEQAWSEWSSEDERKREILGEPRVIAVVGMSPNRDRASNYVALYLKRHGHTIIPVYPSSSEVEGLRAYPDLRSIPKDIRVELVDLFVAPERTGAVVDQAAEIGARIAWFQPGAENPAAEERARQLGLEVYSGVCTKAEHGRLIGA
jgi:predicted CoA-binding protein